MSFDGTGGPCRVSETGGHFCVRPTMHDEVPDQPASERADHRCVCGEVWASMTGGYAALLTKMIDNHKSRD